MEIFSKVHFQPRLLTRSSWWIPLMLLLACSIAHAFTHSDVDRWMDEYSKKSFDRTKRKYIKKVLKELINYDELYIKGYKNKNNDSEKSVYVHDVFTTFTQDENKIREWIDKYNKKKSSTYDYLNGKLKYFRQIVKENMSYDRIINKWNKLTDKSKPSRDNYLRMQFENLVYKANDEAEADGPVRTINMEVPQFSIAKFPITPDGIPFDVTPDSEEMPGITYGDPVQTGFTHPEEKQPASPVESTNYNAAYRKGYSDALRKLYVIPFEIDQNAIDETDAYEKTLRSIVQDWFIRSPVCRDILRTFRTANDSFYYSDITSQDALGFFLEKLIDDVDPETPKRCPDLYDFPQEIVDRERILRLKNQTLFGPDKNLSEVAFKLEGEFNCVVTEFDMARVIELLVIQERNVLSGGKTVGETTLKNMLYKRFNILGREWLQHHDNFDPAESKEGIRFTTPFKFGKCEICGKNQGLKSRNFINKMFKQRNCDTCGRLLCTHCLGKDKAGKSCCQPGCGCQSYKAAILQEPEHVSQQPDDSCHSSDVTEVSAPPHHSFRHETSTAARRLLNGKLSDSSFWEGVLTSLVVLLVSFFAYNFLFTTPEVPPSRRKTVHIKKKRSTFFRTENSEKAQTASQVKGAFSTVIRRQLSKLDEN